LVGGDKPEAGIPIRRKRPRFLYWDESQSEFHNGLLLLAFESNA